MEEEQRVKRFLLHRTIPEARGDSSDVYIRKWQGCLKKIVGLLLIAQSHLGFCKVSREISKEVYPLCNLQMRILFASIIL